MSLRVYVDEKGIKNIMGTRGFYRTGLGGCEQWHIPGIITLAYEKGCCFLTLNEVSDPIPPAIAEFVEKITIREYHQASKRESGIYRYKTAEAEVMMDSSGVSASIFIRGMSKEDALDLLKKIKTGTIRPDESYETPQDRISSKEICAKLTELEHINSDLRDQIAKTSKYAFALRAGVKNYLFTLRESRLPIVFPQTVINKLESIFDPPILSTSIHK